ncbi:hypothetical protein BGX23_000818 [Mortierella sp. AD031]|nr:hypothetical protein BGX23_000818 [Mortierella sp. AD031]
MSGPHHQQSTATGSEHKDQHQHNPSRIQISHLLCSIEAVEPTRSAPWDSPRTEALHLKDPSQQQQQQQQRNLPRTLQQPTDIDRKPEQQDSDSDSDVEERYDHHPLSSPLSNFAKTPIESSPVNHLSKHFSYSSNLTSPYARTGGYYNSHSTSPRHPMDLNDRRDSGLGRRELDVRESSQSTYPHPYKPLSREPLSRSTIPERDSPLSSPPTTTETGYFSSRPMSSGQRSASLSTEYYHNQLHPYEAEQQQQQHRTDRSKSDYALHQQNYGPYLDASPTLPPATLFSSSRPPVNPQQLRDLSTPSPSLPKPSYFREHHASPEDHSRSPYANTQPSSYRSIQSDPRRPSQGIILPPPEAMLASAEPKKSARIYGRDAADGPTFPSFASFGSKPSYDTHDQSRMDYSRRPSTQNADKGYDRYAYEHHTPSVTTYSHDNQSHYQSSTLDRPSYDYIAHDNRRPSAPAPSAPAIQPRAEHAGYSPKMDIQPPSWYQQYAHAVPYKPRPRSSISQEDPSLYTSRDRRESGVGPSPSMYSQHRTSPESWSARSVLPLTPPSAESDQRRMSSSVGGGVDAYGHPLSKRTAKNASHSVHPFDIPAETPASPPKTNKRDREQEDDRFVPEDGVKAKRKRANPEQLSVLNAAFERSYFPSTEERLRLSKQTKMCPRTVQIWFQNKRQSVKARTDAMDAAVALSGRRRASQAVDSSSMEERRLEDRRQSRAGGLGEMTGGHHRQTSSPLSQSATTRHGEKRRRSGPLSPSDPAVVELLQIQLDGRNVDYFSRKRRATIAKMELNESP